MPDPFALPDYDDAQPETPVAVHVFLDDSIDDGAFDAAVQSLVADALGRSRGTVAAVGSTHPLAKSFALRADPSVVRTLRASDTVKSVIGGAGDFLPTPFRHPNIE